MILDIQDKVHKMKSAVMIILVFMVKLAKYLSRITSLVISSASVRKLRHPYSIDYATPLSILLQVKVLVTIDRFIWIKMDNFTTILKFEKYLRNVVLLSIPPAQTLPIKTVLHNVLIVQLPKECNHLSSDPVHPTNSGPMHSRSIYK